MMKQQTLRPSDIVIACQLTITNDMPFARLASETGISVGECHNAVRRLGAASLLNPVARRPASEILVRFLVNGVPYAFPAQVGAAVIGVPTALSAPVFSAHVTAEDPYVWPDLDGTMQGLALTPLFARAAELPSRNPELYDLLAIVDALRVGQVREKKLAEELLQRRLLRHPE
jgi:hypothetical protein